MRVRCTNKDCLHEWDYRGGLGNNDYITCSKCRYKSLIKKAKITNKLTDKSTDLLTDLPLPKEKQQYKKVVEQKQTNFVVQESPAKDKLMTFKDGTQVLIPRPELLVPMLENKNQEQESSTKIKILSPSLPPQIQKAFDKKAGDDPFSNLPTEEPNFEIREIGFNPLKTLNHQRSFF